MNSPRSLPRWIAPAVFLLALSAAWWQMPAPPSAAFSAPAKPLHSQLAAEFRTEMLPLAQPVTATSSLTQLPDGRLAVAWTASDEAETAAAIWLSLLGRDGWSPPRLIANRESSAGSAFAHVGTVGNPVLYAEGGWLHLWYASTVVGSWGALNHSRSTDSGKTWSGATRIAGTPFANLGSRLAAPPVSLDDGGLGLPLVQEFGAHRASWLNVAANGRILDQRVMAAPQSARQLAVATLPAQRALAILSDDETDLMTTAASDDGGQHWAIGAPWPISKTLGRFALLRLHSGRLLLAGNPAGQPGDLKLWLTSDAGQPWREVRSVEAAADGAAEFTEPALLQSRDGRIHLTYNWRRRGIKHAVFSEAWVDGEKP